ncbi:MAG: hypothetical protein AAGA25_14575 [Planctomycetota bacterium]
MSLVIYFGFAMERMQRGMMIDRYESWRGSAKAPGPATGVTSNASLIQLRDTFFVGDDPSLRFEPSDFFPIEPSNELEGAASIRSAAAGDLVNQFFQDYPRGRSMRFFVGSPTGAPMWERLFPGSIKHRHTVMDTDWRFMNFVIEDGEWYDDRVGFNRPIRDDSESTENVVRIPSQTPATPVRETFYNDYDRRMDPLSTSNPLAERLQDFYLDYPGYWGPLVEPQAFRGRTWR